MTYGASQSVGNSSVVNVPTGSAGDILCAFTFDCTGAPAGYTQRGSTLTIGGFSVRLWTKTRTGSEGATHTFTSGGTFPIVHLLNLTGVSEVPVISSNSGSFTTVTGTGVTATAAGTLIYAAVVIGEDLTGTPAGMTQAQNQPQDTETWYQEISAGATGDRTQTGSAGGGDWGAFMAAFPNAGGAPTPEPPEDRQRRPRLQRPKLAARNDDPLVPPRWTSLEWQGDEWISTPVRQPSPYASNDDPLPPLATAPQPPAPEDLARRRVAVRARARVDEPPLRGTGFLPPVPEDPKLRRGVARARRAQDDPQLAPPRWGSQIFDDRLPGRARRREIRALLEETALPPLAQAQADAGAWDQPPPARARAERHHALEEPPPLPLLPLPAWASPDELLRQRRETRARVQREPDPLPAAAAQPLSALGWQTEEQVRRVVVRPHRTNDPDHLRPLGLLPWLPEEDPTPRVYPPPRARAEAELLPPLAAAAPLAWVPEDSIRRRLVTRARPLTEEQPLLRSQFISWIPEDPARRSLERNHRARAEDAPLVALAPAVAPWVPEDPARRRGAAQARRRVVDVEPTMPQIVAVLEVFDPWDPTPRRHPERIRPIPLDRIEDLPPLSPLPPPGFGLFFEEFTAPRVRPRSHKRPLAEELPLSALSRDPGCCPTGPNLDPRLHPARNPVRSFAQEMAAIADDLRQLNTDFGLRPYRVFVIQTEWSGEERGRGIQRVTCEIELLPTPLVDLRPLRSKFRTGGRRDDGTISLREVSARYSEDEVSAIFRPQKPGSEAWIEVREDARHGCEPVRRRFSVQEPPFLDSENFQWIVPIAPQVDGRTRKGRLPKRTR